jgi:serine/threonine-protein kinase
MLALVEGANSMQVGPYILERPLARGAHARVWAARDIRSGRTAAVKIAVGASDSQDEVMARLQGHRAIIELLGRGVLNEVEARTLDMGVGARWIAMELATSGSLAAASAAPNWRALRGALLTILDALAHAHGLGVAHLDVKPENVLVVETSRGRRLKLADFGSARVFGESASIPDAVEGTRDFVAPEVLRNEVGAIGPRADLYAVGVLGWTLATGKRPRPGWLELPTPRELAAHFDAMTTTPPGFVAWVHMLTRPSPDDRYRSAQAAIDALRGLSDIGPGERRSTPLAMPVLVVSGTVSQGPMTFDDGLPATQPFGKMITPPDPFDGLMFDAADHGDAARR